MYFMLDKQGNGSLVPKPPRPMGERQSGTVASNSWSKASSIKCLFHTKRMFVTMNVLFVWKRRLMLGPRI